MTQVRYVNFYPPCDNTYSGHPWRTTSWITLADALKAVKPGCIAPAVRVEFEVDAKALAA